MIQIYEQRGFTIVEVLVTLAAASLFISAIYMLQITQIKLAKSVSSYSNADQLAYNNLRVFANGKSPTWFTCNYVSGSPAAMTLKSSTDAVNGITPPVTQTVTATAPYGCGGGSSGLGYPIRVISSVTYGPAGKTVVHATYASY